MQPVSHIQEKVGTYVPSSGIILVGICEALGSEEQWLDKIEY